MGVDLTVLDFLLKFKGTIRGETLQLGRQGFHVSRDPMHGMIELAETILRRYVPDANFDDVHDGTGSTGKLFHFLGSRDIVAMDASDYEGAEIIHDLNTPVPDTLRSRFDTIFDGGTIEHVFSTQMAFDNVKRMLKPGGLFLSVNAANNQLGHGFYQFSPELMWRVFSQDAGYLVKLMQIVVLGGLPQPVDIPDPATVGRRLEIGMTEGPTYILVAAEKVRDGDPNHLPQQSDYRSAWAKAGGGNRDEPG